MPRIDRTADVTFDWCHRGQHFAPAGEFKTRTLKDGRVARRSMCRECENAYRRAWNKTGDGGPRNGVLSQRQKDAIRERYQESARVVAADYGVHRNTVYAIWRGS